MYRMPSNPNAPPTESTQQGTYRMPSGTTEYTKTLPDDTQPKTYRMPNNPTVTNPDSRTIGNSTNQATAIRLDDGSVDVRRTWSSAKIQEFTQASEAQIVWQFVSNYGEFYFSEYDETKYDDWTLIVDDAMVAMEEGTPFYVAWSEHRSAQVVNADSESEPRMTVVIDGRCFIMTDIGIQEIPIFNVVIQCQDLDTFPEVGDVNRLYIDLEKNTLYYWTPSSGYVSVASPIEKMHRLTFGAGQQYVYDGSADVTVPVYMGQIS